MFYLTKINNKTVLKSDLIKTEHFFTTRESLLKSDESGVAVIVQENKRIISEYLNISLENLISPIQTHSSNVELARSSVKTYPETDGLIVTTNDIAIFLNFADCTPLIFYDAVKNVGAVAHAGWKGTAQSIAPKTVDKMVNEFGCSIGNIATAIGPAISVCCYDVGEDVFAKLESTVKDFSNLYRTENGKRFIDLKGINAQQLREYGIKKIDICPYCTSCDNNLFFSYRKENKTTSRHSAVLRLTK